MGFTSSPGSGQLLGCWNVICFLGCNIQTKGRSIGIPPPGMSIYKALLDHTPGPWSNQSHIIKLSALTNPTDECLFAEQCHLDAPLVIRNET